MRVVLDTNIWLSGLFWDGEANKIIEQGENKRITILISEEILLEIKDVLQKESKFTAFLDSKDASVKEVIKTILFISELITPKTKLTIVKDDPDDNKILEAAVDGKAKYIITYDKHLLSLEEFQGISMLHPKTFLTIM
jgi:putative PIN family toxin of toxin-antitoxin system